MRRLVPLVMASALLVLSTGSAAGGGRHLVATGCTGTWEEGPEIRFTVTYAGYHLTSLWVAGWQPGGTVVELPRRTWAASRTGPTTTLIGIRMPLALFAENGLTVGATTNLAVRFNGNGHQGLRAESNTLVYGDLGPCS